MGWAGCNRRQGSPYQPGQKSADTVAAEPQMVYFPKTFPASGISKVVSYSFLDEEEDDTSARGQLLQIMPNYTQYLRKDDRRSKVVLTGGQVSRLLSIVNTPGTYKLGAAFCYNPRNCFCFYNNRNEIIGFYEICFECSRMVAMPELNISRKGGGLTDSGAARLAAFCRSIGVFTGK